MLQTEYQNKSAPPKMKVVTRNLNMENGLANESVSGVKSCFIAGLKSE